MHPDLPFAQRTLDWAHSRGICIHLLFGFVMGDKYGCCVGERMAGFLPMSLTTSVAIPMDVAPRTHTTRARGGIAQGERRGTVWRGGCVWRLVALATTGGNIRRFSQDKHKTRPRAHAHTGQPEHTHGGGRALTSVLSLYLGVVVVGCLAIRAADASLSCHLRSCQYDRSLQT